MSRGQKNIQSKNSKSCWWTDFLPWFGWQRCDEPPLANDWLCDSHRYTLERLERERLQKMREAGEVH